MDNKKTNSKRSLFSDRRFKYGSLAVTLTAAFVALAVALNAVIYALAYTHGWYIDMTGDRYYGITDKSKEVLDDVLTEDVNVKIIFCQPKDMVLDDSAGYYIYRCAETYKKAYPNNIKVEFLDIVSRPDLAEKYTTQLGTPIYQTNIIIETDQSPLFKLLTYDNFYTIDSDSGEVYAFNGERRFTSYMISLCTGSPKCYFTEGHGEDIYTVKGSSTEKTPNALYELMVDAGFDVQTINLSEPGTSLDDAKVVVINDPVNDFQGSTLGENEIEKLRKFMSDGSGNIMVLLSPDNAASETKLTTLKSWLYEWGISVSGSVNDKSHSLTSDGTSVIADYPISNDFGPSLHYSIRQRDSQPYTIIDSPLAITCHWHEDSESGYQSSGNKEYSPVLYSYASSALKNGESEKNGAFAIASLVRQTKYDSVTQQTLQTYMFVSSTGYANEDYLQSNAYGNKDIIYQLAVQMGKKLVPMDIDFKVFESNELTISTAQAYALTVVVSAVIPALIVVAGAIVYHKRKRL